MMEEKNLQAGSGGEQVMWSRVIRAPSETLIRASRVRLTLKYH